MGSRDLRTQHITKGQGDSGSLLRIFQYLNSKNVGARLSTFFRKFPSGAKWLSQKRRALGTSHIFGRFHKEMTCMGPRKDCMGRFLGNSQMHADTCAEPPHPKDLSGHIIQAWIEFRFCSQFRLAGGSSCDFAAGTLAAHSNESCYATQSAQSSSKINVHRLRLPENKHAFAEHQIVTIKVATSQHETIIAASYLCNPRIILTSQTSCALKLATVEPYSWPLVQAGDIGEASMFLGLVICEVGDGSGKSCTARIRQYQPSSQATEHQKGRENQLRLCCRTYLS